MIIIITVYSFVNCFPLDYAIIALKASDYAYHLAYF